MLKPVRFILGVWVSLTLLPSPLFAFQEKNFPQTIEVQKDRIRNLLSDQELKTLSPSDRNELALERYIKGQKDLWEVGRDYEMFIGYEYEKDGWDVVYFGIEEQLNDMGRDLIAKKGKITHIIQCKYWSRSKTIHENHINQLYGTTSQYIIAQNRALPDKKLSKKTVIPVFVTSTKLSDVAKMFAKDLQIRVVEHKKLGAFPRVKCKNSLDSKGNPQKRYYLPFDPDYDRIKIQKPKDLITFTVKEAEEKGFRRD